jgi:hypothetical protein
MRAHEFLKLLEKAAKSAGTKSDPLFNLKRAIAHKIKDLPSTPETKNSLEEIEDILSHVQVGGRRQATVTNFESWSDADVKKAKDLLAKYVISLDAPVAYKKSMIDQWKNGGLIDTTLLLDGSHTIDQIVKGYSSNPAVKELADDLLQVASLGKGKGEFMLKVLSPAITDAPGGKGDLLVRDVGTVEVKTTDGGASRFYDRQVKAGSKYYTLSSQFIKKYTKYFDDQQAEITAQQPAGVKSTPTDQPPMEAKAKTSAAPKPFKLTGTGLNINHLATLYKKVPKELENSFTSDLTELLGEVFTQAPEYAGAVVSAIAAGDIGRAKQLYGVGSLNNYMAYKNDVGVLYIDLTSKPYTFTFFTDNASLNKGGLRLNIGTVYPVSTHEQYAFPQTTIVKTGQEQPEI